jgi:hypothetical protein
MKVWIVHDSKFGNGKSIAEAMGQVFQQKTKVKIAHIKVVSPHRVAEDKPELLIVGTAIRAFSTSSISKIWIRRLKKELRKVNHIIPLGVVFITHVMKKETVQFWGRRFHNILERGIAIGEVYPGWLSGKVTKVKGPLDEGILDEFIHISQQILANIG